MQGARDLHRGGSRIIGGCSMQVHAEEARMEARAKLFGHAIHQMLIVLPLGLLTDVVIFDVIGLPSRERHASATGTV